MMHTWGNAIFQKGVCLFHLNLKKNFALMYYSIASLQTEILNDLKHQVLFFYKQSYITMVSLRIKPNYRCQY